MNFSCFTSSEIFNYIMKIKFFCKLSFNWEHSKTRQACITHLWSEVGLHQLQFRQEAQLSPSDRAMRLVSSNLANYLHGRPVYKIWSLWRWPLRRNYTGCKIPKRFAWPWQRPFQGIFFIGRVGLAMVSQCTKFEVSRFTRYDVMNGGAKCRKWGSLGQLGGTQGHRQCHHSIERIGRRIRF